MTLVPFVASTAFVPLVLFVPVVSLAPVVLFVSFVSFVSVGRRFALRRPLPLDRRQQGFIEALRTSSEGL